MTFYKNITCSVLLIFTVCTVRVSASEKHSIARSWNEMLLTSIRQDLARPTVHARNLFHHSLGMYEAYAAITDSADHIFLGQKLGDYTCTFQGFTPIEHDTIALKKAINYLSYRLLTHRFSSGASQRLVDSTFFANGGDFTFTSVDYTAGSAEALGNYIAQELIAFGLADGSGEQNDYANTFYTPVNPPIAPEIPGNNRILNPNRWQQIELAVQIDQSGNIIPGNTQPFLSPEWGDVTPFALKPENKIAKSRDGMTFSLYDDIPSPPFINTPDTASASLYKWGFSLVALWSGHLSSGDTTRLDISPKSIGNITDLPNDFQDYPDFYNLETRKLFGSGHSINPATNMPYTSQVVKRGDYTRAIAEYWADGPDSETPPGHWFTILNYVDDHPKASRKYFGTIHVKNKLRWEIYSYLLLGAAMHDVAISTWAIKGYHDYIRPVSALRYMADQGQCSDPSEPNYNVNGIPLVPGYIELVQPLDRLARLDPRNLNKIKVRAWQGPDYIRNPATDTAGVGWILLENWWPYQRPSFVTPPFAGYISGHSTFSSAAADILEAITGDAYFPGGLGEWDITKNEFLVFEEGPSESFKLQWATYQDAAAESGLSRIWGGIHPPFDDVPGRLLGPKISKQVLDHAKPRMMPDRDGDGFTLFEDIDDTDSTIYPGAPELCDSKDNDGNGLIDDNLPTFTYYLDLDKDSFGNELMTIVTCYDTIPAGYVLNALDCNDSDFVINPHAIEILDNAVDENCDGEVENSFIQYGPNPTSGLLTLFYADVAPLSIQLFDNQGKLVLDRTAPSETRELHLDLSGIREGIYLLRVTNQQQQKLLNTHIVKSKK